MYVQWDTVDLFPPSAPENKEKRKADRHLVQVTRPTAQPSALKDVRNPFAYHRLWACEKMEAGFNPPALHTTGT